MKLGSSLVRPALSAITRTATKARPPVQNAAFSAAAMPSSSRTKGRLSGLSFVALLNSNIVTPSQFGSTRAFSIATGAPPIHLMSTSVPESKQTKDGVINVEEFAKNIKEISEMPEGVLPTRADVRFPAGFSLEKYERATKELMIALSPKKGEFDLRIVVGKVQVLGPLYSKKAEKISAKLTEIAKTF